MGRATAVAVVGLLAVGLAVAPAQAAQPPRPEPPPPPALKPAIPQLLAELETEADTLEITSARVSLTTSLRLGKVPKQVREFARLFEFKIEGVETTNPPAGAFELTLFGSHVRLRYVDGRTYLFSWALGLHDGGRPWVELGKGALGRLFGSYGAKPQTTTSASQRYAKIFTLVNNGIGIHELPPTTLYGQPVTGFEAEVEPDGGGALGKAAARHRRPSRPNARLSVYFAAGGALVRAQVQTGTSRAGATVTSDFPAIDFPYTIPPPPPSHVIAEATLVKRSRPHRG